MLVTKIKPTDELIDSLGNSVFVICCDGCSELSNPESDVIATLNRIAVTRTVLAVDTLVYMCNEEYLNIYLQKSADLITRCDSILVFSCGVGVQILNEKVRNDFQACTQHIIAGFDTYPLPGFQGLTPSSYDCALCGDCHLNETGAICPVTACSKSLLNGQCGGAKNGKCEVDTNIECGWERICKRLERYNAINRSI